VDFRQTQLDNGLTVIAEVNPAAASLAVGFFVVTGSRDETPALGGVSHFLEHMVFKGTSRRQALDVNREIDEMGADCNAGTTEENTIFYASVLPAFRERLIDLLADILRPALRQDDFDTEKQVILDEIALYEDQPQFRVYEKLMAEHFDGHPLGNAILGTRESISALSRQDMRGYFDRRYSATNITAVGTGNVDYAAFTDQLQRLCGGWPGRDAGRQAPAAPRRRAHKVLADEKVVREHVGLMSPAPAADDERRYAASLLACALGDSSGSRLYHALVEPALADEATVSYSPMDGAGAFVTFLSCDAAKAPRALAAARAEFARFMDQGPSEEELLAAKNKIATAATLKGELPIGRLSNVGFDWIYRRQYVPLERQIERLFEVSPREVLALARDCDITAYSLLALGPAESI